MTLPKCGGAGSFCAGALSNYSIRHWNSWKLKHKLNSWYSKMLFQVSLNSCSYLTCGLKNFLLLMALNISCGQAKQLLAQDLRLVKATAVETSWRESLQQLVQHLAHPHVSLAAWSLQKLSRLNSVSNYTFISCTNHLCCLVLIL